MRLQKFGKLLAGPNIDLGKIETIIHVLTITLPLGRSPFFQYYTLTNPVTMVVDITYTCTPEASHVVC